MAVRTERSEVRTKTTEGQYSPVRLELARLVSSLLYGTLTMFVLSLPAFENKKYVAYDRFHGNGPYGEIPTKKEPIRTLGFTLPYNNLGYLSTDITCSEKRTVFREPSSRKTVDFEEEIVRGQTSEHMIALNGGYCHKQNAHNSFLSKIQTSLLPLIQTFLTNGTRKTKFQLMINSVENIYVLCGCFVFTVKLHTFDQKFVTVNYNSSLQYTLFFFRIPC